jgi:CheY-like chemotaxis protein
MFQQGVQFNPNELQAGQGSGLGLFISKNIVEKHCGRLFVTSEGIGHGASFFIELPLVMVTQPIPVSDEKLLSNTEFENDLASDGKKTPMHRKSSKEVQATLDNFTKVLHSLQNILIVDDTATCRKLLIRSLVKEGYNCSEAKDGQEFLDMVSVFPTEGPYPFDLVLLDFEMPVLSGPAAVKKLRELDHNSLIVIGLTGNILEEDVEYFKSCGADAVLSKPVVLQNIFDAYKEIKSKRMK